MGAGKGKSRRANAKRVQGAVMTQARKGLLSRLTQRRGGSNLVNDLARSINKMAENKSGNAVDEKREDYLIDRLLFAWDEVGADYQEVAKMLYHGGEVPKNTSLDSLAAIIASDRDRHEYYFGKEEADARMSRQIASVEKARAVKLAPLFVEQQLERLDKRFSAAE